MTIDDPEGQPGAQPGGEPTTHGHPDQAVPAEDPAIDVTATTDDDDVDDLVGGLFREVDDRFTHLAARFQEARKGLTPEEVETTLATPDPVAASTERYALVSEVATLRSDVERQAAELDERDRMLADLGNRIVEFEDRLRVADEAERAATIVRQELHEERRELARVRALLEASSAEREELAEVAQRLTTDKDQLDGLLSAAVDRFEEVDRGRAALAEDVARIETARQAEAQQYEQRYDELTTLRAETRRMGELIEELTHARDEAIGRADKAESKNERRANEVNYLNRRIESLTERAAESDELENRANRLGEENTLLGRRVADLEREVEAQTNQAAASAAAVEAIADRSAQHDELVARIAELEAAAVRREQTTAAVEATSEIQELASRARALGAERTSGDYAPLASGSIEPTAAPAPQSAVPQAPATPQAPSTAQTAAAAATPPASTAPPASPAEASSMLSSITAAADVAEPSPDAAAPDEPAARAASAPQIMIPEITMPDSAETTADPVEVAPSSDGSIEVPPGFEPPADEAAPSDGAPQIEIPGMAADAAAAPSAAEALPQPAPEQAGDTVGPSDVPVAAAFGAVTAGAAPEGQVPTIEPGDSEQDDPSRRRMVLPADMEPDTPAAVHFLLNQPGVTAIVDARSFCGRTGVRPSELFSRMEALRDQFDVPVEVVVTPVSTPVGGIPSLPAIGVHAISGADTVADRIRALCIGFPPDQPLVVIAGDDHVRRAAIGEEANVVDPSAVFEIT